MQDVNRLLLFAGADYYPSGGVYDYRGSYSSKEEAVAEVRRLIKEEDTEIHWAQIVDRITMQEVCALGVRNKGDQRRRFSPGVEVIEREA